MPPTAHPLEHLDLYARNRPYLDALNRLCTERHWTPIKPGWWGQCYRRLANPRHKCSHNPGPREHLDELDHVVWLRRGPGRAPTQWAILAQPYGIRSLTEVARWANAHGAVEVAYIGPAPYGHGTTGLLIVGTPLETP